MSTFDSLPKESKKLFCILYKQYLKNLKDNMSKSRARFMDNSDYIQKNLYSHLSVDDVSDICRNLHHNDFIECHFGDDLVLDVSITDDAIAFMQHRFKNGIKDLTTFITSLIP
ncbi:hypothetical protein [Clostridium ihumii]|uniref:hypothetical protein n=1 Tax=Clostridium ihumii TaxID=1470356 RepID=UPI00054D20DA|nr:hypothetical protein [Clostridium ihumii]